jgi:transcription factor E
MQSAEAYDHYIKVAGVVGGDDAAGVVAALITLKSATDEQIANHANLRLPSVRRTLYKLLSLGLARYEEKKDPESQKTYYIWSPAIDQLEGYIMNMKRVIAGKIRAKLEHLRSHMFFHCGDLSHKRLTFEEAMESFYRCPMCNNPLFQVDNSDLIKRFEDRLLLLEGDVKEEVVERKSPYPTLEEARELLVSEGASEQVVKHCEKVAEVVSRFLQKLKDRKIHVNTDLALAGAMLHDIGRAKTHQVSHGMEGGEIIRRVGYPEDLARVVECHVGGGIGKGEVKKLFGIDTDLSPKTIEEKLVSYADKLVEGNREVPFSNTMKQYRKKFGPNHLSVKRLARLDREMRSLLKVSGSSSV